MPFDLNSYIDESVLVQFVGGRQLQGKLVGYDPLVNLCLENTVEYIRDQHDLQKYTGATRELGTVIARGTTVTSIAPVNGMNEIQNPFVPSNDTQQAIT